MDLLVLKNGLGIINNYDKWLQKTNKQPPTTIDSVISVEKTNTHSEKHKEVYEIIEKLYPNTNKIEIFARNKRKAWGYDIQE